MAEENKNSSQAAAVVLGLSPTGLHVVRALGRTGVKVGGISEGLQTGLFSKYLHAKAQANGNKEKLEALIDMAASLGDANSKPILIPTSDQDVELIIDNAALLAEHYRFQASYEDGTAQKIMDKSTFYEMCAERDISYPELRRVTTASLHEIKDKAIYPCLIKPAEVHHIKNEMRGKKGWIVQSKSDFDQVTKEIPKNAGTLLVQNIVPGPEHNITLYCGFFDGKGNVHQAFTSRKLRQYPPGFGSASLVQSNEETDTKQIAEEFLLSVGYRGIAAAEFKRDPETGKLMIIEINVRPSLWFGASSSSGKHPVLAAYHHLAGLTLPSEKTQKQGLRWKYGLKDAYTKAFYKFNKNFVLPAADITAAGPAKQGVGAVFASDDIKPVAGEFLSISKKIAQRLRGS